MVPLGITKGPRVSFSDNPFSEQKPPPFIRDNFGSMPPGATPPSTPYTAAPRLNVLALLSMLIAFVSPVFFCCCYLSTFPSFAAVVLGHVALVQIGRSQGALYGRLFAGIGLFVGYIVFLASVAMIVLAMTAPAWQPKFKFDRRTRPASTVQADALSDVERAIATDNGGIAHGNSPAAKKLAEQFSVRMKELRDIGFTKSKNKIQLSGGNFITHCELHPGKCAFVVHVPSYRNFAEDAKETLAGIAWKVAQETVADSMEPGDKLAVGMKGTMLYGAVMTGTVAEQNSGPDMKSTDQELLKPFFEIPVEIPETPEKDALPASNQEVPFDAPTNPAT